MRGTIKGCESAMLMRAKPLTHARASASRGKSGGLGYFSSSHSRMASDWNSFVSPSTSVGTTICGLTAL